MNPRTALIFRLAGPSIEVACAILLRRFGDRGLLVLGQPVETLLYVGFGIGLVLVICGLTLVRTPRRPGREARR